MGEIDGFTSRAGVEAPPAEATERIDFEPQPVRELDLDEPGITTVIWATGYRLDFSWIDLPAFDGDGYPVQDRGVTEFPGLYFLGLHWLYTMLSGSLAGVGMDAQHIAQHINARATIVPEPAGTMR